MRKWKVKKKTLPTGFPTWLAFNAYGHEFRYCPTWREALNYADEMARTRTYVLPRARTIPTDRHHVRHDGIIVEYATNKLQIGRLSVEPWERRPLALALLAADEKENQCAK